MRLLYLCEGLTSTDLNTNMGALLKFFCSIGWDPTVLATGNVPPDRMKEVLPGVSLVRLSSAGDFPRYLVRRRESYDAVFCYNARRYNAVLPWLKLCFGKRIIIKTDNIIGLENESARRLARSVLVVMLPLAAADLVLTEAPSLAAVLRPYCRRGRIVVLPNCMSTRAVAEVETRLTLTAADRLSRERILLYVGRLSPEKGVEVLIQAFSQLAVHHPSWHLCLVGPGADTPYGAILTRRAAEAGLAGKTHFAGEVEHEEIFRWQMRADLFCLPSYREGISNALTEAMFFGTPIVATRVGLNEYQLDAGRCGRIVEPGDVRALTRTLDDLMSDDELRSSLGRAARDRAWRHFSTERCYLHLKEHVSGWDCTSAFARRRSIPGRNHT